MTIASAITAAQGRVADAYTAISNKGGTLPQTQNLTNMPTAIASIPSGSGGDTVTALNTNDYTISSGKKVLFASGAGYYKNFTVNGGVQIDNTTKVATNFNATNYITQSFLDTSQPWELGIKVKFTDVSTGQNFFSLKDNGFSVGSGSWSFYLSSTSGSFDIASGTTVGSVSANTWYWIKFVYSGSDYNFYVSTDGETYSLLHTFSSSAAMKTTGTMWIGNYDGTNVSPATYGSIDLSATYLKINGANYWVPTFTPYTNKIGNIIPADLYTFTGSPQGSVKIDNDFIASNFSHTYYVQYTKTIDFSQPWEFNTRIYRNSTDYGTARNHFIYSSVDSTEASLRSGGFGVFCEQNVHFTLGFTDDTQDELITPTGSIVTDSNYFIKCGWTGSEYYIKISTDGQYFETKAILTSSKAVKQTNNQINIGSSLWVSGFFWQGTIYLTDTYIRSGEDILFSCCENKNNLYSGVTEEAIASFSSGSVTTILPE